MIRAAGGVCGQWCMSSMEVVGGGATMLRCELSYWRVERRLGVGGGLEISSPFRLV